MSGTFNARQDLASPLVLSLSLYIYRCFRNHACNSELTSYSLIELNTDELIRELERTEEEKKQKWPRTEQLRWCSNVSLMETYRCMTCIRSEGLTTATATVRCTSLKGLFAPMLIVLRKGMSHFPITRRSSRGVIAPCPCQLFHQNFLSQSPPLLNHSLTSSRDFIADS